MSKTSAIVKRQGKIVNRKLTLGTWRGPGQVESAEARDPCFCGLGGYAMKAEELIERDPEKDGVVVFTGTRVPVEFLFQFLEDDQTLETFLDQFPSVSRAQAQCVLGASRDLLLSS